MGLAVGNGNEFFPKNPNLQQVLEHGKLHPPFTKARLDVSAVKEWFMHQKKKEKKSGGLCVCLKPFSKHPALEKDPSPAHSKADFPPIPLIPKMRNVWRADTPLLLEWGRKPAQNSSIK